MKEVTRIPAWIRVPKLPLDLYTKKFLWRVGSCLGTTLKVNRLLSIHSCMQFSRICVEIDLSRHLVSHIMLKGRKLNLEYGGLHAVCFWCGRYGHKKYVCLEFGEKEGIHKLWWLKASHIATMVT